jgi:hypothetical protein
MAIDIEAMYGDITDTGMFRRLRYPLDHALLLPRDNVVALILSADTVTWRGRTSWGAINLSTAGTSGVVERIAESASLRSHIFIRRGGEVCLAGWEDDEWWWRREADLYGEDRFTRPSTIVPGDSIVFQAPIPALDPVTLALAYAQMREGMY